MKLTDTKLRALKPREKPFQVADGHGLIVEVHPGGAKTWFYRYRFGSRAQRVRIGRYPEIPLQRAREKRLEAARVLAEGKSPAAERRAAKQALDSRLTVDKLAEIYMREVATHARKDTRILERYVRREIRPTMGSRPVQDIKPADILIITDRMKARGVPLAALDCRNFMKRMFDYAVIRQVIQFNPAAAIPAKTVAVPKSRDRALRKEEIKIFLTKLYESNIARRYKLALHLILLTLVRKSELVLAKWVELDLEQGLWEIPAANNKMGKPKVVYLSKQATALFLELKELSGKNPLVLAGRNEQEQPVCKTSLNAALRSVAFGIEHFTIHDSRRTASTLLNEMGWNSDVIEKALGHEIGGVRGIYNRAEYASQRRDMLQQWADFVHSLMTENKVVLANFSKAA